jgi:hypothetical protein
VIFPFQNLTGFNHPTSIKTSFVQVLLEQMMPWLGASYEPTPPLNAIGKTLTTIENVKIFPCWNCTTRPFILNVPPPVRSDSSQIYVPAV